MMWWYGGNAGMWPGWGWIGFALMILFWGAVVWVAVVLVQHISAQSSPSASGPRAEPTPRELLAQRFARGEIDADEYRARLALLQEISPSRGT